ncbi:MAG: primosomal protein N' [Steroidobacteraceae bacterium]|nr:primosomal protein N' [Steroidobacteraceae bacterium]
MNKVTFTAGSGPFLRVALDTPLRRSFDYRPPAGCNPAALRPGLRVEVPFGSRTMVGVIVELAGESTLPPAKLRTAHSVLDTEPVLDAVTLDLVRWAAEYYHHPIGEAYAAALPSMLRAGRPLNARETRWRASSEGRAAATGSSRLGPRQRALLDALGAGSVGDEELDALGGTTRDVLRALVKRGWVESFDVEVPAVEPPPPSVAEGPAPTSAQQSAVDAIVGALGTFAPFLLHGVTGSGKTEVYLRVIREALERGQQALVLVPEIALTPQAVARFRARFAVPLAVLHSGLTAGERLAMWRAARDGSAPVVIGTRSAIYVPLPNPGVIVVDEEHDASYKQQEGFRYSARDLAVIRAQRHGIPVVLGSATPSLETLQNAIAGRYRRVDLPERAGAAGKPRVAVVDLRVQPQTHGIATPVAIAAQRHLEAGAQVLFYLNRRGFAPTLFCPGCGWTAPCEQCDARLTVHRRRHVLACHHCGAEAPVPYACPVCSTEVRPVGQGTERIEDVLDELFPGAPVVRVDRDTIRKRGEIETALERVHSGEARILVGTQMLTKGHDFPDVTLVVVLNADQGLFGTDFRAAERLAQSIVQVAGRAGRASRPGEVLIQTACPDHPLLKNLLESGYDGFAQAALVEREQAHWPPYTRLAVLRAEAPQAELPMRFLVAARDAARDLPRDGVRLLGPAPAAMERRAGRWRAQLLLEAANRGPLQKLLGGWLPRLDEIPESRRVRWSIDVDPLEVT